MAHERAAGQTLVHEAMAARFSVQVVHEQPQSARQAVCAAFAQLDMLEGQLSRFVEGSDVWRINRLRPGETAVVALDTFRCLALALELQQRTDSAFDVTYPSQPASLPAERLGLSSGRSAVQMIASGVEVDLGDVHDGERQSGPGRRQAAFHLIPSGAAAPVQQCQQSGNIGKTVPRQRTTELERRAAPRAASTPERRHQRLFRGWALDHRR